MPVLTLLASLVAQAGGPPITPTPNADVVVIGPRYAGTLERCLKTSCPPEQEVDAAMNVAAEYFRDGRYLDASKVLRKTISRNKRFAGRMPGKISDLYATYADVALNYGDVANFKSATRHRVDVLREHLGLSHPATLASVSAIGHMMAALGDVEGADRAYASAARNAAANGQHRIAALITVRRAFLAADSKKDARALKLLDDVAATSEGDTRVAALANVVRIKLALRRGDDAAADRLLAVWKSTPGEKPTLIFEPELAITEGENNGLPLDAIRRVPWIDIGFWVRPSGAPAEIEVLRPASAVDWAKPLIAQISKRRYGALVNDPGSLGIYQIQRYSVRRAMGEPKGSRILGRVGNLKVVQIDMTEAYSDAGLPR